MASLSAHLREPGNHGALAFHPACPICRSERLAGTLPADALVGRRTQALVAAGVLAFSSAAPAAALAQEPDQEQEGSAAPDQAAVTDPAGDPDFDPGGESTDLPSDGAPTSAAPVAADPDDDTGAVEQEPTTNEDAPIVDAGDGTSTASPAAPQAPPTAETSQPPPPTSSTPSEPADPAPAAYAPGATADPAGPGADAQPDARADARKRSRRHANDRSGTASVSTPAPQPVAVASNPSEATTVYVAQESRPRAVSAGAGGRAARPGDRSHVVFAGESLWSISRDVLGDGASVANIAREVNRLWTLNRERIGTGDPDLLMVGTRLVLR